MNAISDVFASVYNTGKKAVPVNIRQYVAGAMGNNSPLTEADLWPSDIQALRNAVNNTTEPGVIGYGDYGPEAKYDPSAWQGGSKEGIGLFGALLKSYLDPKFRMETTLGMANFNETPDGNVTVTDNYNFGATPEQVNAAIQKAGGKGKALMNSYRDSGFEGLLNAFGNLYVAPEGDNSIPVRINFKR